MPNSRSVAVTKAVLSVVERLPAKYRHDVSYDLDRLQSATVIPGLGMFQTKVICFAWEVIYALSEEVASLREQLKLTREK